MFIELCIVFDWQHMRVAPRKHQVSWCNEFFQCIIFLMQSLYNGWSINYLFTIIKYMYLQKNTVEPDGYSTNITIELISILLIVQCNYHISAPKKYMRVSFSAKVTIQRLFHCFYQTAWQFTVFKIKSSSLGISLIKIFSESSFIG